MAPKDFIELRQMLEFAVNYNGPIAIRYPRGGESERKFLTHNKIEKGKAEVLREGEDISIIAIGKMVAKAHYDMKFLCTYVMNYLVICPLIKRGIY